MKKPDQAESSCDFMVWPVKGRKMHPGWHGSNICRTQRSSVPPRMLCMWCRNTSSNTSLLYFGCFCRIKRWYEVLCISSSARLDKLNQKILPSSCRLGARGGMEKSIWILGNMAKSEPSIPEKQESKTDLCYVLANRRNRGCMLIR